MSGGRSGPWRALEVKVRQLAQPTRPPARPPCWTWTTSILRVGGRSWLASGIHEEVPVSSIPDGPRLSDAEAHMVRSEAQNKTHV
jgi:hypothetical protein